MAATVRKSRANARTRALEYLGNKCVRCGFSDRRALQIDHINGTAGQKRLNPGAIPYAVLAGVEGYQLLCANCNWIKRVENREYPQPKMGRQISAT